jgi:F-type H+-transporting ATPase subunit epsilon
MSLPPYLTLEIVTPERAIVHDEVDEVEIPGSEGYLGILPGHTPLLSALKVGQLWYRKGTEKFYLSIAFGFVEVLPDRVRILADIAERAEEIDVSRAEAEKRRAEDAIQVASARKDQIQMEHDLDRARASLMKAMIRLQVATKARIRQ